MGTHEALKRLQPDLMYDEVAALLAFDQHRAAIYAAAAKVYVRSRKGAYELSAEEV
jgi:hypothetical protein